MIHRSISTGKKYRRRLSAQMDEAVSAILDRETYHGSEPAVVWWGSFGAWRTVKTPVMRGEGAITMDTAASTVRLWCDLQVKGSPKTSAVEEYIGGRGDRRADAIERRNEPVPVPTHDRPQERELTREEIRDIESDIFSSETVWAEGINHATADAVCEGESS
jgi:hypothetical protein